MRLCDLSRNRAGTQRAPASDSATRSSPSTAVGSTAPPFKALGTAGIRRRFRTESPKLRASGSIREAACVRNVPLNQYQYTRGSRVPRPSDPMRAWIATAASVLFCTGSFAFAIIALALAVRFPQFGHARTQHGLFALQIVLTFLGFLFCLGAVGLTSGVHSLLTKRVSRLTLPASILVLIAMLGFMIYVNFAA